MKPEGISESILGCCDMSGPCADLKAQLKGGFVVRISGALYMGNGIRFDRCFLCHGKLKLTSANLAAWRWDALRPLPEPKEAA